MESEEHALAIFKSGKRDGRSMHVCLCRDVTVAGDVRCPASYGERSAGLFGSRSHGFQTSNKEATSFIL